MAVHDSLFFRIEVPSYFCRIKSINMKMTPTRGILKRRVLGTFLVLTILLNPAKIFAQSTLDFEWPVHKITPIFKDFIKAYNTNDLKKITAFTTKYYEKDVVKAAAYWPRIFAEYAEITPFIVATEWSNERSLAIWFQGKHTKNWVEITLHMNTDNGKIVGKTVARGYRPSGTLPPYNSISSEAIKTHLKAYLKKLDALDYFSGSVLVAKGDTILFEDAYGDSHKKRGTKNDSITVFNIASTTKTVTAIAIAKLAEQGKLKFTDLLSTYVPEYPKDIANQVSIHHLLTHTSGIELDDYEPFNIANDKARNLEESLQAQLKYIDSLNEGRRNNFKVLNKHDYSNENFTLLGVIIERSSGMSYAEYIEKTIFEPLGMKNSFVDIQKLAKRQNKAVGYTFFDKEDTFIKGIRRENEGVGLYLAPEGGIYSNPRDLYTYFKAINKHTFINRETKELLQKKHVKLFATKEMSRFYGYGFEVNSIGKATTIGHRGVTIGVGSTFEYYPKEDYYVIVLSNYGSMPGAAVAAHIRDLISPN